MIEDKLTRRERIRLEALSQAANVVQIIGPPRGFTFGDVLAYAEKIEIFLLKANQMRADDL